MTKTKAKALCGETIFYTVMLAVQIIREDIEHARKDTSTIPDPIQISKVYK